MLQLRDPALGQELNVMAENWLGRKYHELAQAVASGRITAAAAIVSTAATGEAAAPSTRCSRPSNTTSALQPKHGRIYHQRCLPPGR